MQTIAIRLRAQSLENPDLDIRHELPKMLAERSGGVIWDDGYDFVGPDKDLVLLLQTSDIGQALDCILGVISSVRVLGNNLRDAAVVAVDRGGGYEVAYPPDAGIQFELES